MRIFKRALVTVVGPAVAALSMAFAAGAFGAAGRSHLTNNNHHGQRHGAALINESLAPSQPTDPTFRGVTPGGAPWVLKRGEVRLKSAASWTCAEGPRDPGARHAGTRNHDKRVALLRRRLERAGGGHD